MGSRFAAIPVPPRLRASAPPRESFPQPPCAPRLWPYVGSMARSTPPHLADFSQLSLADTVALLGARKLPPVESWRPERTGDSAMEIRADGSWYHEGGRIDRPAMGRLFSQILDRKSVA